MLLSNPRIIESVLETLGRLQQRCDLPRDAAYDLAAAADLLRHVQHVDQSGGEDLRGYCRQAVAMLESLPAGDDAQRDAVLAQAREIATASVGGSVLKHRFIEFVASLEAAFVCLAQRESVLAVSTFSHLAPALMRQHNSLALSGEHAVAAQPEVSHGATLNEDNLTAYLRDKLADPGAQASGVTTLPGGFGKETTLFTLRSATLNTDLVVRRDAPINIFGALDCHVAPNEYALLKAVHARGFPAPEPMFSETATPFIAGPAFTIMRRAAGAVVGDVTGGSGRISPELHATLAQIAARLHAVEPLAELAHVPALNASLWKQSAGECTRDYIGAWYRHYLASAHLPLPVLHGLFNWLLDNVPAAEEPSVLVHGDIGFHNLVFDDGRLSAVLDWEFAHVGDRAEDIGYIRSTMGNQIDWPLFIAEYAKAGGKVPSEARIRYFEIWSQVRNAAGSVMVTEPFATGRFRNIKYTQTVYRYTPYFIAQAEALVAAYERGY